MDKSIEEIQKDKGWHSLWEKQQQQQQQQQNRF
jgi:hypothetical protein